MNKEFDANIKKIKALAGAMINNLPFEATKGWSEDLAIFQRTPQRNLKELNLEHDPNLSSLHESFKNGRFQEIKIEYDSGKKLNAWFLLPKDNNPTILYTYGNAANLTEEKCVMECFAKKGFGFLGWSYPGYEYSDGKPSENGFYNAIQSVSGYLMNVCHIAPLDQIAIGHSLGTLVTIDAATKISFRLVVLMAAPTNIPDYYEHLLSQLPEAIRALCSPKEAIKQHFDGLSKAPFIKSPVLFINGDKDAEVPLRMLDRLFEVAPNPKYKIILKDADHDFVENYHYAEQIALEVITYAK